jgi:hypothetical protein
MNRRLIGLGVALLSVCSSLAGCETLRQSTREKTDESTPEERVAENVDEVKPSEESAKFFKANRLSGGWSSEARDIESHLGVR